MLFDTAISSDVECKTCYPWKWMFSRKKKLEVYVILFIDVPVYAVWHKFPYMFCLCPIIASFATTPGEIVTSKPM